jgi:hypothetical protein
MRGNQVELLPEHARSKLTELTLQKESALDSQRGCASRLGMLPAEGADHLRARLTEDMARHAERHRALALTVSRCNQFVFELKIPANTELAMAPVEPIKLKPGETVSAAIRATREEIKSLQQKLAAVKSASLPVADQIRLAERYVAETALVARPQLAIVRDQWQVVFRDDVAVGKSDLFNLLCWFAPSSALAVLKKQIEAAGPPVNPLTREAKEREIGTISNDLLAAARKEEYLIERAGQEGQEVARRGDASPWAVLGVQIISKEAAAA